MSRIQLVAIAVAFAQLFFAPQVYAGVDEVCDIPDSCYVSGSSYACSGGIACDYLDTARTRTNEELTTDYEYYCNDYCDGYQSCDVGCEYDSDDSTTTVTFQCSQHSCGQPIMNPQALYAPQAGRDSDDSTGHFGLEFEKCKYYGKECALNSKIHYVNNRFQLVQVR
ncbi:hypothetical protein CYMTET_49032 [Cymbomonas tetramitiformis]|uniref:Uncharacterized protein n=1 Tax=Cymbomonas tetramitiformis TaxID=36881 RepID=A0AAE0EUA4_9CHLO|nr:hypothetical protein CYMTET_49032 [Cymbomonas tetramitiformis]